MELEGLEFLKENEIEDKPCDLSKPFAFISYAHDEHDTEIVRNVFSKLNDMGYNLWLDTANIPNSQNSWSSAAQDIKLDPNLMVALFFRSEESVISQTILKELKQIQSRNVTIITVDIWHDDKNDAGSYYSKMLSQRGSARDNSRIMYEIYNIVDKNCIAIGLRYYADNFEGFVNEIANELGRYGVKSE